MANMSYCKFQNTLLDFQDCKYTILEEGDEELSNEEHAARSQLFMEMFDLFENLGIEVDIDQIYKAGDKLGIRFQDLL